MPHLPWWCLRHSACQVLERSPARVHARPPRPTRWYGSGLYGRPTASGELCSRHQRAAADRPRPWGTTMLVHHLATDAQVEGKVINRGSSEDPRHRMDIH
jgi:hypothetical protein